MEWPGALPKIKSTKIDSIKLLDQEVIECRRCPRLVDWREEVALEKRKSYQEERYWGKAVPGFGSTRARLLIVGLAPGAHGANRTGRIFTGDSSGDWLYASLHKNGLAKMATSISRGDGQKLFDTRITCTVKCVPPGNKPERGEILQCRSWLEREFSLLWRDTRTYLTLGAIAWSSTIETLLSLGEEIPRRRPKFTHGANFTFLGSDGNIRLVIGSYHPSQQNTFTGRLTRSALDSVVKKAGRFAHAGEPL
jgi:uracil-DNA glycosylase family 4